MLRVTELRKAYDARLALNGLSMHLQKGEAYALLGPNGAGKSTAIHILSGLLQPDSGSVHIDGMDLRQHARTIKMRLGVVPQEIALYEDLSARQNLRFWGGLYGLSKSILDTRVESLLERIGLSDRANDAVEHFSGGMKRRVNIAAAVLHEPDLLFLDEPTVGIDPQSRHHVHEMIQELHQAGMTILYTTHYMEEAEKLCNRIGILDQGKLVGEGTLAQLRQHVDQRGSIHVQTKGVSAEAIESLRKIFGERLAINGNALSLVPDSVHTDMANLVRHCGEHGVAVEQLDVREADLEGIFLHLTGRALRD